MMHPNGIKKTNIKMINYGNRGMALEEDINLSNEFYRLNDIAIIHKKPTPITITKVDYPSRLEAVIKEAYFKTPSTTDYNGVYKGRYIDFEAKETRCKNFPLANIHIHQLNHLRQIEKHNGIAFIIVRFSKLDETFVLIAYDLFNYLDNNTKKSIPYSYFKEKGFLLKNTFNPRLDYLKVIDKIYFGGNNEKRV